VSVETFGNFLTRSNWWLGFIVLLFSCGWLCGWSVMPSVLWHSCLGGRNGIRPVKLSGEVLAWLFVWSEVQTICIWSSWCHCHPIISCSKIQNGLPFWCGLNQVVLEKSPLNGCSSSAVVAHVDDLTESKDECVIVMQFYWHHAHALHMSKRNHRKLLSWSTLIPPWHLCMQCIWGLQYILNVVIISLLYLYALYTARAHHPN